jgi:hypothetical protein
MKTKRKQRNTKGKLKRGPATSTVTTGAASAPPATLPTTPVTIFQNSIKRARTLAAISTSLVVGTTEPILSDAYRASIVLAVSALDAFVRTLVIEEIIMQMRDPKYQVTDRLRQLVKDYLGHDGLFDGARQGDLISRIDKALRDRFEEKSFQGVKNIADALQLIGHNDVFHAIAISASVNEDNLKSDLGKFTKRRHLIAHCGDHDLSQTPPVENTIAESDATRCIEVAELVVNEINKLR